MKYKNFKWYGLLVTILVTSVLGFGIATKNIYLAIGSLIVLLITLSLGKKSITEVVEDERSKHIGGAAATAAVKQSTCAYKLMFQSQCKCRQCSKPRYNIQVVQHYVIVVCI